MVDDTADLLSDEQAEPPLCEAWRRHLETHPEPPPRSCTKCHKVATMYNTSPHTRGGKVLFRTRCRACRAQWRAANRTTKAARITDMLASTRQCHKQRVSRGRHEGVPAAEADLITRAEFVEMVEKHKHCYHCACELQWDGPSSLYTASLDRLDNDMSYVVTNVVLSCIACNDMRRSQTVEDFHAFLRRLAREVLHGEEPDDEVVGTHRALAHMAYMRNCRDSKARHVWTAEQYADLAAEQKHRCYYTGAKLRYPTPEATKKKHLPWPCSFDQLEPQGGYGENTVMCLRAVNYMRRNFSPEAARKRVFEIMHAFA